MLWVWRPSGLFACGLHRVPVNLSEAHCSVADPYVAIRYFLTMLVTIIIYVLLLFDPLTEGCCPVFSNTRLSVNQSEGHRLSEHLTQKARCTGPGVDLSLAVGGSLIPGSSTPTHSEEVGY